MGFRVVRVQVETVSQEYGWWCNRCMLPSACRIMVAVTSGWRMHLQTHLWCLECDTGDHVAEG